jgi:hypothetical protein
MSSPGESRRLAWWRSNDSVSFGRRRVTSQFMSAINRLKSDDASFLSLESEEYPKIRD